MKNEWTEQDLRQFVESSQPVFQDVSLTQVDEDAARCWQDDGLMVDYELRGGQVDCVLRRCVVADGKVWQLQMTAPLAGTIWKVLAAEGQTVAEGEVLLILEAMKMETEIRAAQAGTVRGIAVKAGDAVAVGDTLLQLA